MKLGIEVDLKRLEDGKWHVMDVQYLSVNPDEKENQEKDLLFQGIASHLKATTFSHRIVPDVPETK
jgi:hypothetical protein